MRSAPAAEASLGAAGQSDEAAAGTGGGLAVKLKRYSSAVYKFTRPHTIRGMCRGDGERVSANAKVYWFVLPGAGCCAVLSTSHSAVFVEVTYY